MNEVWLGIVIGMVCIVFIQPRPSPPPVEQPKKRLGPFDVYLINLDSATQRLSHFKKQIASSDLVSKSFIRVPAIKGASLNINTMLSERALWEVTNAERTGYRLRHYQLSRGAVGCYASHVKLWENVLKTDKSVALVFEDDAQIYPRINEYLITTPFPEDFDIVLLGYECFKCKKDEGMGFHRVRRFFGLHGYLISAQGIRKIMASPRIDPIHKQIDAVLSDMADAGELTIYATTRKLVEQNNEDFSTQIQLPIKEGQDPWAALQTD